MIYQPRDATFMIPVYHDSVHRKENLHLTIRFLKKHLSPNIILMEQYLDEPFFEYLSKQVTKYVAVKMPFFHRTKMLNQMAMMSNTPVIVNWDADVLVPPVQMMKSLRMLGENDFVYPYDGNFVKLPREVWLKRLVKSLDTNEIKYVSSSVKDSLGGAVFAKKDSFFSVGGENENFISYGPEDLERYHRYTMLGYKTKRVNGNLYHMNHHVGINSYKKHQHYQGNVQEWEKIRQMTQDELSDYIGKWEWKKQFS